MENETRLRPIVYTSNYFKRGSQNTMQQMLLLKAIQITQDPNKLREMIGVRTVAEVYRTLDKLAMRKEFHEALSRSGISFDFIVQGIKDIAVLSEKDDVKLKAYQALLKSLGMDKYDIEPNTVNGTWEEALLKKLEDEKQPDVVKIEAPKPYDVKVPEMPDSEKKKQEEEDEIMSSIYEKKPGATN